ncbi:hypothetical protein V1478_009449 [Vespula squamosa]|uniref:Uncharacterized protein n=1 Tax=Vespula squamosa TaxID=30214 RepID=A0ABD2AQC8_VESSQ
MYKNYCGKIKNDVLYGEVLSLPKKTVDESLSCIIYFLFSNIKILNNYIKLEKYNIYSVELIRNV